MYDTAALIPPEASVMSLRLGDSGGAYIAHDSRRIARSLGSTPVNTPVRSPQSHGMAESFVDTFRRGYESRKDLTDAPTVLAEQMRRARLELAALYCAWTVTRTAGSQAAASDAGASGSVGVGGES